MRREGVDVVKEPKIQFRLVLAHSKVEGNERAKKLARSTTDERTAAPCIRVSFHAL